MYIRRCVLLFYLVLAFSCVCRSQWKALTLVDGVLNCHFDSGRFGPVAWPSQYSAINHCVGRLRTFSDITTGYIVDKNSTQYASFIGSGGNWMEKTLRVPITGTEVLDLNPSSISWIPVELNPPESSLIDWHSPFQSYPRKYICRNLPIVTGGFNRISVGHTENGTCVTDLNTGNFTTHFELLTLNAFNDYLAQNSQNYLV